MVLLESARPVSPNMSAKLEAWPRAKNGEHPVHLQAHVYELSEEEIAEVHAAMQQFKALGLDGDQISPAYFPLPTLGRTLQTLTAELHHGRGFFVLRGLNPRELSAEDTILRYLGISSYVGDQIAVQDEYGNVFAHVREAKYARASQEERPVRDSTLASAFHTDEACDILAMYTSGVAAEGGNHLVAPAAAVYAILCEDYPEAIPTLMEPNWHFATRGRLVPHQRRAILFDWDGRIIFNFNRQALFGVPGIEPHHLTRVQIAALDAVEAAAVRVQVPLTAELGDMAFVNNFTTLHAREEFRDSSDKTRHLVRMWRKNSRLAYTLPPPLAELNARLFDPQVKRSWNVLPKARLTFSIPEIVGP